jgi:hypothetical protein
LIVAAVPLVGRAFAVVPGFRATQDLATFCASTTSFLAAAFLFGLRRHIGEKVFPTKKVISRAVASARTVFSVGIPLLFAVIAVGSLFVYIGLVRSSVERIALRAAVVTSPDGESTLWKALDTLDEAEGVIVGSDGSRDRVSGRAATTRDKARVLWVSAISEDAYQRILRTSSSLSVPDFGLIILFYTSTFVSSVVAFVWLGLVEYVQHDLGVSDTQLLSDPYRQTRVTIFPLDAIEIGRESDQAIQQRLYFQAEFDPDLGDREYRVTGPYCGIHRQQLQYVGHDGERDKEKWQCRYTENSNTMTHVVWLTHDLYTAADLAGRELGQSRVTVYDVLGNVIWPRV